MIGLIEFFLLLWCVRISATNDRSAVGGDRLFPYDDTKRHLEGGGGGNFKGPLCRSTQTQVSDYFETVIELFPYYEVKCTQSELRSIAEEMTTRLDMYFLKEIISLSNSCLDVDTDDTAITLEPKENNFRFRSRNRNRSRNLQSSSNRQLKFNTPMTGMTFLFKGGGRCRYCYGDDEDGYNKYDHVRRLDSGGSYVTVTIFIETDKYALEMGYRIETLDGTIMLNKPQLQLPNSFLQSAVRLQRGETYTFVAYDINGDGWCCDNGNGWGAIYVGSQESPLVEIDGDFKFENRVNFTVPSASNYFVKTLLPSIEAEISAILTHEVWTKHHYNENSCLLKSGPTVSVDLQLTGAEASCSV